LLPLKKKRLKVEWGSLHNLSVAFLEFPPRLEI
jgi:hypothetical protein